MPYIPMDARRALGSRQRTPRTEGELNYAITLLVQEYLKQDQDWDGQESYSAYNAVIGALECVKLELYRRKVSPYEDIKLEQNGDVY